MAFSPFTKKDFELTGQIKQGVFPDQFLSYYNISEILQRKTKTERKDK